MDLQAEEFLAGRYRFMPRVMLRYASGDRAILRRLDLLDPGVVPCSR